MRLGILGGTFNPIHCGHLLCAAQVREKLALDQVIFIPTGQPPHKEADPVLAPYHRLAMAYLATNSHPAFTVSALEVERPGKSYSVETVEALRRLFPASTDFFFILGSDAFAEMGSWKDTDKLLKSCHFAVVNRPGHEAGDLFSLLQDTVRSSYPELEFHRAGPGGDHGMIRIEGSRYGVYAVSILALDISASEIRSRLRQGRDVTGLVPETVERHIVKYGLYLKEDSWR
ncbi:MAG: nicotinate-nucleotide adenylyltransferase [Candidatus Tectomicrobia bacterium]|uniref:Probable nicotinate-nucleotide adenylyltransferase n=1 Tax=Tectimicrobiota bacterium TaxID=2528274 RepID=A0A932M1I9_UNCTE|nr:nicotinate-nucleotide adenylyltransferase [Candidatus Tectomicrobia bacterium]